MSNNIHLKAVSQELPQPSVTKIGLKISLKSLRGLWIISSPPGAAYMNGSTGLALVQIMDGAKPSFEPMLTYCQLDPKEHISIRFYMRFKYFDSRKCIWTCHLHNGSHFVQEEMWQMRQGQRDSHFTDHNCNCIWRSSADMILSLKVKHTSVLFVSKS